ncbi:hypothetical protein P4197_28555 [Pseudomonas aeruginosa]|nr:hypothetical protein [Pseudomonas aeruginosa]
MSHDPPSKDRRHFLTTSSVLAPPESCGPPCPSPTPPAFLPQATQEVP